MEEPVTTIQGFLHCRALQITSTGRQRQGTSQTKTYQALSPGTPRPLQRPKGVSANEIPRKYSKVRLSVPFPINEIGEQSLCLGCWWGCVFPPTKLDVSVLMDSLEVLVSKSPNLSYAILRNSYGCLKGQSMSS